MDSKKILVESIARGDSSERVAMRMLVLSPTHAFKGCEDLGFEIIEEVADFFDVSVRSVHACGSAKLGFSPVKGTDFVAGHSDLDLAIIDHDCFNSYVGAVIAATRQYRDRTGFNRASGNTYRSFVDYLAKGMFRPDLMPYCEKRRVWMDFFGRLSIKNQSSFSSISAAIYLSDQAFRLKQSVVLAEFGKRGKSI